MQVEDKYRIPPIIHFIWAGGAQLLDESGLRNIAQWAIRNPRFTPILWVDEKTSGKTFNELESEYKKQFIAIYKEEYKKFSSEEPDEKDFPSFTIKDIRKDGKCKPENDIVDYAIDRLDPNYGLSSDILRYRILSADGGVYVDVTDVTPSNKLNHFKNLPSLILDDNASKEPHPKHVVYLEHLSQKVKPDPSELDSFVLKPLSLLTGQNEAEIYLNELRVGNDSFICTPNNPFMQMLAEQAEQNLMVKGNLNAMVNMAYSAHNIKDMTIEATGPLLVKQILVNDKIGEIKPKTSPFTCMKIIKGHEIAIKPMRCSAYQITQPIQNTRYWNNAGLNLANINNLESACNKLVEFINREITCMGILRLEDHIHTIKLVAMQMGMNPIDAQNLLLKQIESTVLLTDVKVTQLISNNASVSEFYLKHGLMSKTFLTSPVTQQNFNIKSETFLKIFESVTGFGNFNANIFEDKALSEVKAHDINVIFKPLEIKDIFEQIKRGANFISMLKNDSKSFPIAHELMTGNASSVIEEQYFNKMIQKYAKILDVFADSFMQQGVHVKELLALNDEIVRLGGKTELSILSKLNTTYKAEGDLGLAFRRAAHAGKLEDVMYLSNYLNNVNEFGLSSGKTALHFAAENGHTAVTKFLVEKKNADPTIQDKQGKTPLDLAKNSEVQDLLKPYIQNYTL